MKEIVSNTKKERLQKINKNIFLYKCFLLQSPSQQCNKDRKTINEKFLERREERKKERRKEGKKKGKKEGNKERKKERREERRKEGKKEGKKGRKKEIFWKINAKKIGTEWYKKNDR